MQKYVRTPKYNIKDVNMVIMVHGANVRCTNTIIKANIAGSNKRQILKPVDFSKYFIV